MSEQFNLTTDEKTYKEGSATHFKSMINGMQGYVYLTSNRIVFCSRGWFFNSAFGQLLQLISKPKRIDFEIPLNQIQSISKESHGFNTKNVFKISGAESKSIIFTTSSDKWIEAIISAVENNSQLKAKLIGDLVEFTAS